MTCKALSSLWRGDSKCQALWLLRNSSSIEISSRTQAKLNRLADIAEELPGVAIRDLMQLKWALQARPGSGRYGECQGARRDGCSCQSGTKALNQGAAARAVSQGTSASAASNSILQEPAPASCLPLCLDVSSAMQAIALSSASSASLAGTYARDSNVFKMHGREAHMELMEHGGPLMDACWAGDGARVKQLSVDR